MADDRLGGMVSERHGSGPAVVAIHGLGGTSNSFQPLMAALDGYCVLRPDLPGAGRSAHRPGRPGIAGLATAVRDCLRAHAVSRAHFVGHSMGTLICQHLAATAPELVASLTLFGAILEPAPTARDALRTRADTARAEGMAAIADQVSTRSLCDGPNAAIARAFVRESLMRQGAAGYAAHCEALSAARAVDHGAIGCSTLVVQGVEDTVAPVAMAERLCSRIGGARLETLAGVGHWPMVEAPGRAGPLLGDHLRAAAA